MNNHYYGTFGSGSVMGNFYVAMLAPSLPIARAFMAEHWPTRWCTVYEKRPETRLFPMGELLRVVIDDEHLNFRVGPANQIYEDDRDATLQAR